MEKMTIEIDFKKIVGSILEKDVYADGEKYSYVVEKQVAEEIKGYIRDCVLSEVKKNLVLGEFLDGSYMGSAYLTDKAKSIIEAALKTKTEEYVNRYIDRELVHKINRIVSDYIEKNIESRLNKLLSGLFVINQEKLDEEIEAMREEYENNMER
jgi:hypothetical protein